ncbi:hypothetical protein LCGC14_2705860 [marine sediment metagenome]|uniref:Uncharacterized protein n=1 Tax=marine sediment metagenome TaxID=412755 RepID=A0A0F9BNG4_9ZZZZ
MDYAIIPIAPQLQTHRYLMSVLEKLYPDWDAHCAVLYWIDLEYSHRSYGFNRLGQRILVKDGGS